VRALDARSAEFGLDRFVLLDVRDEHDFLDGHLEGSGHLPVAELTERRGELPPRDTEILVVAADGVRARDAAQALEELGYRDVAWLDAALRESAGERLVRTPPAALWRPSPKRPGWSSGIAGRNICLYRRSQERWNFLPNPLNITLQRR